MKPDKVIKFKDSHRDYFILELAKIPGEDNAWWLEMFSSRDGDNKKDEILSTIVETDCDVPTQDEILNYINSRTFSIQMALLREMERKNWV